MENPFLSIVIPVYNGLSNGLPKCLNYIWEQSLHKETYEVICIDDCSTDDTRSWLKEQQKEHANLIVIENEKNIRQGGARNKGVRAAKGKYICFIDQDDYYHKESLTQVYDHLSKNDLEILIVDCAYQSPGKESDTLQHNFPHREIMTGDEQIERNSIPYAPWKFVFQRSLMVDNNLFFAENERIEDVDWVHVLTHHATRTQYQPILFIHYNKTTVSTTMTSYKSPETVYSTLRVGKRLIGLTGTTFASSNDKVKRYIRNLGERMYHLGLRNYFFFCSNIKDKTHNIKNTAGDIIGYSFIVRIAKRCPKMFSVVSNLMSPFGTFAMWLYRTIKYR